MQRHLVLPPRDEEVVECLRSAPSPSSYAYAAARSCVRRSSVNMSLPDALPLVWANGEELAGGAALPSAGKATAAAVVPVESGSSGAEFPGVPERVWYAGSSTASSAGDPRGPEANAASGCSVICIRAQLLGSLFCVKHNKLCRIDAYPPQHPNLAEHVPQRVTSRQPRHSLREIIRATESRSSRWA